MFQKEMFPYFQYNKKPQTNLSSNLVPVGYDFLAAKGTAMVAMQIFQFPIKNGLRSSKKNKFQLKFQGLSTCNKFT